MSNKSVSLWYPRYVGDYQRKTSHLSLAEHGVYCVLLDHYYATGKPLPASAAHLQRICRAFAEHEAEALQSVLQQFFILDDNVYRNKTADEQLVKRGEIKEKRQSAALKSHANAGAKGGANAPTPTPTPTPTIKDKTTPKNLLYSDEYESLWKLLPRGSKSDGFKSYQRALKETNHENIIRSVTEYLKSVEGTELKFIAHLTTFLNGKRWETDHTITVAEPEPQWKSAINKHFGSVLNKDNGGGSGGIATRNEHTGADYIEVGGDGSVL